LRRFLPARWALWYAKTEEAALLQVRPPPPRPTGCPKAKEPPTNSPRWFPPGSPPTLPPFRVGPPPLSCQKQHPRFPFFFHTPPTGCCFLLSGVPPPPPRCKPLLPPIPVTPPFRPPVFLWALAPPGLWVFPPSPRPPRKSHLLTDEGPSKTVSPVELEWCPPAAFSRPGVAFVTSSGFFSRDRLCPPPSALASLGPPLGPPRAPPPHPPVSPAPRLFPPPPRGPAPGFPDAKLPGLLFPPPLFRPPSPTSAFGPFVPPCFSPWESFWPSPPLFFLPSLPPFLIPLSPLPSPHGYPPRLQDRGFCARPPVFWISVITCNVPPGPYTALAPEAPVRVEKR